MRILRFRFETVLFLDEMLHELTPTTRYQEIFSKSEQPKKVFKRDFSE